ncbi:MAG: hypothetical protein ACI4OR_01530 [Alphaproteobacteria bacterium]
MSLLESSNAILGKKTPVAELVDENVSLNRKNRFLWMGLIGLSALSALSIGSCHKTAKELNQSRLENRKLKEDVSYYQQDASKLVFENHRLKNYAEEAHGFALGIRPWLDENDFGCEDPNCPACKKMEKENEKKLKEFSKAVDTIGIDSNVLNRLQKGYEMN